MEKTKKTNGMFQREFEIAQLLREINPGFRRGVTPVTSPNNSYDTAWMPNTWTPTGNTPGTPNWQTWNPTNNFSTPTPWTNTPNSGPWGPTGQWNTPNWWMQNNTPWGTPWASWNQWGWRPNNWATTPYTGEYWNAGKQNGNGFGYTSPTDPPPTGWENGSQAVPTNGNPETWYNNWNNTPPMADATTVTPPANVTEYEKTFCIEMMVPGFNEKDCTIKVSNGILWVHGWRKTTNQSNEPCLTTTCEFTNHSFRRCFVVSEDVDMENIKATCTEGILTLTIPKKVLASQKEKKVSELV